MIFLPTHVRRLRDPARLHNYEDAAELTSFRSRRSSTCRQCVPIRDRSITKPGISSSEIIWPLQRHSGAQFHPVRRANSDNTIDAETRHSRDAGQR